MGEGEGGMRGTKQDYLVYEVTPLQWQVLLREGATRIVRGHQEFQAGARFTNLVN